MYGFNCTGSRDYLVSRRFAPLSGNRHTLASDACRAFTLIELLVVVAVLGLLLALLLPGLQSFRTSARTVQCANNLHQLGRGLAHFAYKSGRYPSPVEMLDQMGALIDGQTAVYACPDVESARLQSYGVNACLNRVLSEAQLIAMTDSTAKILRYKGGTKDAWDAIIAPRHAGMVNTLSCDGSVMLRSPSDIKPVRSPRGSENLRSTVGAAASLPGARFEVGMLHAGIAGGVYAAPL